MAVKAYPNASLNAWFRKAFLDKEEETFLGGGSEWQEHGLLDFKVEGDWL